MVNEKNSAFRKYLPYFIFLLMFIYVIWGLVKVQIVEQSEHKQLLNELLGSSDYSRGLRGSIYSSDGVKLAWSEQIPIISMKTYTTEDDARLREFL
ncbi:MAG TPA: peptidoglycan glycosyltransferase, partial [Fervidobacterium sp.]|nr:peptidoglycan glycosyltransferase [Fervidobacterium sp.]